MERSTRFRNKISNNLRMKASSLYHLNNLSNIDSTDSASVTVNWREDYSIIQTPIGRGHFSKVYKVKCYSSGSTVAIKVIRRKRMGTDKIDEIMQEIEIMNLSNKSSNSGFIQLLKVHTNLSEVAIVMEFAAGGTLYNVTQDSRDGLPDIYVRIVLTKILSALGVLHHQEIVHLDIKADNILLRHPYPSTDVVLTDFGLARKLSKSKVHRELAGTPDYIAPEVANYEEISLKSDMWSVGVLTYFLLTNVSPFAGCSKDDTLHRVSKTQFDFVGQLNDDHLQLAKLFITSLLVKMPQYRLNTDECISHEFLSNIPIVECSTDRVIISDAPVDIQVQVRPNPFPFSRGMVMSQYDIDSTHNHCNLTESDDTVLKVNSAEAIPTVTSLEFINRSESNIDPPNEMEVSVYSIDQRNDCGNTEECYGNAEEVEEMIDHMRTTCDSVRDELGNSETQEVESSFKVQSIETNECNEHSEVMELSFTDIETDSLGEMHSASRSLPTDTGTETTTSDSYSVLMKHEELARVTAKEDQLNNNQPFKQTAIYDSRRRSGGINKSKSIVTKTSLATASFRSSRENIIDAVYWDRTKCSIEPRLIRSSYCVDSEDNAGSTLRSVTDGVKRRSMLRVLKKDSDKPSGSGDKSKRRSAVLSSNRSLNGDVRYKMSGSNPTLAQTDKSGSKKSATLRASELFSSKRVRKESKKERWNCVIS